MSDEQLEQVEKTYADQRRRLFAGENIPLTTAHLADIEALCREVRRLKEVRSGE